MTDTTPTQPPVKMVLKPVPDRGIRVQSSKTKSSLQFALPGSLPEPGGCSADSPSQSVQYHLHDLSETIQINTTSVPQPFLEPDKLEQWK
ncbi:hypothetical protein CFAM422_009994 [Trichoderma lentiforme]|uniref:Uncharacterized protein n=1 Tax=Trichoderma lentiforme TaxID=1567552 RepID=A0A9P4X6M2_9HYPO|nr:hypothetical protein CFAM422_009994 [Trichoderma lentiforme]